MKLSKDEQLENLLEIKGINAQGFGSIAKLIMRDKRLNVESKAIYSYICSFAGSGTTAFPSVAVMVYELNVSKGRFYKYRQQLVELNYIEITQERASNNKFARNVYHLIQNPVPLNKEQPEDSSMSELLTELAAMTPPKSAASEQKQEKGSADLHSKKELSPVAQLAKNGAELFKELSQDLRYNLSFCYQIEAFKESTKEIIEALNWSLLVAETSTEFKFNKKPYTKGELVSLFNRLDKDDLGRIIKSIHKEWSLNDIKDRPRYILGCVFKIAEDKNPNSS